MAQSTRSRLQQEIRRRVFLALEKRVVWFTTGGRHTLEGEASEDFALVAVIGRGHYEPTRRRYPIRSWGDLRRVVLLELGECSESLAIIGPLQGDEREVTIFRLSAEFPAHQLRALFWVPETLLLADRARRHGIITVRYDDLEYFVAENGETLIAGGAIRSAWLFGLASGVSVPDEAVQVQRDDLVAEFLPALLKLQIADWWMLRSRPAINRIHSFLRPAAAIAALALIGYLAFVSTYLYGMQWLRERQLQALGPEVTALIAKQRAVDVIAAEGVGLVEVIDGGRAAWPVWEAVATIWRAGGGVFSLNITDNEITIRCAAPSATEVLKLLQTLKGFENAQLDSAVRQGMLGQEFVVVLKRSQPGDHRP